MKKSLHDAISNIYNTKWTLNTNFYLDMTPHDDNTLWGDLGLKDIDLNLYLKSIELPQYGTNTVIEEFINDRYRIAQGVYDVAQITLSFKDFDSFILYKTFLKYLTNSRNKYFNDISFNIDIYKLPDYPGEETKKIMTIEKCIIKYVSKITLSNESEAQIGEFDVQIQSSCVPKINILS